MSYQAIYDRDRTGRMPVSDAIDRLGPVCQVSVDWQIGLPSATRRVNDHERR